MPDWHINLGRRLIPPPLRRWVRSQQRRFGLQRIPAGTVNFGQLRTLKPISRVFGVDRGTPIDRYYIDQFLSAHQTDIRGGVLEIGDDQYTRKFGADRVQKSDVLHYVAGNPLATIVADLTCADQIPSDTFDCIIVTQTLQMIYEPRAALRHLHRILKPQGVLLLTSHGISRVCRHEGIDDWGEYWHFTSQSLRRLLAEFFPSPNLTIQAHGNVLAAIAFLHGLAAEELTREELDYADPNYEVLLTARASKPAG